jgi:hypothetical protein
VLVKLITIVLLLCEARWRFAWLRAALVVLALFNLDGALNLGPAMRRAIGSPQRMNMPAPPSATVVPASDYVSGVLVMRDEANRGLSSVTFPLYVLVWLAISPVVLDRLPSLLASMRHRRKRPHQSSDVG